jgi:hypothetical protein
VVHQNPKGQNGLSLIGRCAARAATVDLNQVLGTWQGGGHPAASAASIKLSGGPRNGPGDAEAAGEAGEDEGDVELLAAAAAGPMEEGRLILSRAHAMILSQIPAQVAYKLGNTGTPSASPQRRHTSRPLHDRSCWFHGSCGRCSPQQ